MENAHAAFLSSLDGYAAAADLFRAAAARTPGAGDDATAVARRVGAARAVDAARAADAKYAAASAVLQRALRAAGLSPDVRFPAY
jgi:hypothetical protein